MKSILKILPLVLALVVVMPDMTVAQKRKTKTTAVAKKGKAAVKQKKTKTVAPAPSVSSLRNQRDALQKKIKQSEAQLNQTRKDVKKQLSNLAIINAQIDQHQRNIGTIKQTLD